MAQLERLGRVRHLVAANVLHWRFIKAWQRNCPASVTWAVPGLRKRRQVQEAGLRFDCELRDAAPEDWGDEMKQVIMRGAFGFEEVEFFHSETRTLILTDLVVNLEER